MIMHVTFLVLQTYGDHIKVLNFLHPIMLTLLFFKLFILESFLSKLSNHGIGNINLKTGFLVWNGKKTQTLNKHRTHMYTVSSMPLFNSTNIEFTSFFSKLWMHERSQKANLFVKWSGFYFVDRYRHQTGQFVACMQLHRLLVQNG